MFDYFKRLKEKKYAGTEPQEKSKSDKSFIAVIAFWAVIVIIKFVAGMADSVQNVMMDFKINLSDIIILGTILLTYLILKFREGRK